MAKFLRFVVLTLVGACASVPPPIPFPASGAYIREVGDSKLVFAGEWGMGMWVAPSVGGAVGYEKQVKKRLSLGVTGVGGSSVAGWTSIVPFGAARFHVGLQPQDLETRIGKAFRWNFGFGAGYLPKTYVSGTWDVTPQFTFERRYGQISFAPTVGLSHCIVPFEGKVCSFPIIFFGSNWMFSVRPTRSLSITFLFQETLRSIEIQQAIFATGLGLTYEFPEPNH